MNLITTEKSGAASLFIEYGIDALPFNHKDLELGEVIFKDKI